MSKPFEVREAERVIAEVQAQLADTVTITISREDAKFLATPGAKTIRWNHPMLAVVREALKEAP